LRWRVLLLDHDDTTVDSTATVHYPAHVESLRVLRPDLQPISLEGYFEKNHSPGISKYFAELFTAEQMPQEKEIWRQYTSSHMPHFFPGMLELLKEYSRRGGKIVVISHSEESTIRKHYANAGADGLLETVIGWNDDPSRRKPAPWPAQHALEITGVSAAEALVADDLSPGVKMAKAAGVAVVGTGWGHNVPEVRSYMQSNCEFFAASVDEFRAILLEDAAVSPAVNEAKM